MPVNVPPFSDLPLHKGDPPNSAWGLWGNGPESALGSLNHLTDDLVLRTVKEEIQTGQRVGLDLPLNAFDPPLMGRTLFEQKIIDKHPTVMNDDVITFNTQGSSQWDSLRHYANQTQQKFYNGVTQQDVLQSDANGLQPWCKQALAGRGVLIDYAAYAEKHNISVNHFGPHPVTLQDVQTIAKSQGVEFRKGDVLFLRTGYVKAYKALKTRDEREKVASVKHWCGLGQGRDVTEWLWERQFAAVASDTPGFEVKPPLEREWHLHTILLAGWGTPIGELFNLDDLAELCKKHNRWTFFFTSSPLNYAGAVASPPNAVAIM